MPDIASSAGGLAVFILGFGFIVFVHELGHFAVAKWVGIKVEQFAVGMGHAIVSYRKGLGFRVGPTAAEVNEKVEQWMADYARENPDDQAEPDKKNIVARREEAMERLGIGETEYRIAWIPIGGYVKMLGQDDIDPNHRSTDPRSYNNKTVGQRMAVISAGVIMNIIFGLLFFMIAFMAGVNLPPAIAGDIPSNSPAATTFANGHEGDLRYLGLKPGDRITMVNGEKSLDFSDVMIAAPLSAEGEKVVLTVEREAEPELLTFELLPELQPGGMYAVGIDRPRSLHLPKEEELIRDELKEQGVKPRMNIVAVGGESVSNYAQYLTKLSATRGRPQNVTFEDDESKKQVTVSLAAVPVLPYDREKDSHHLFGLVPAVRVLQVVEGEGADNAGIEPGDILAHVGGKSWPGIDSVANAVKGNSDTVRLKVNRDGELIDFANVQKNSSQQIGIHMAVVEEPIIASPIPGTSVEDENLVPGARILEVAGRKVETFRDVIIESVNFLQENPDAESISLKLLNDVKDAEPREIRIPFSDTDRQLAQRVVWMQPVTLDMLQVEVQTGNPLQAASLGIRKTRQTMIQVYLTLMRLIQNRVPVKEMRGPVGIAEIGTVIARDHGTAYFFFFLGLISVNLAVINFLPVPVVDGGHMVFLILEKIKGSPVSVKIQAAATYAGFALILTVFVFTFYNDAMRLITGG